MKRARLLLWLAPLCFLLPALSLLEKSESTPTQGGANAAEAATSPAAEYRGESAGGKAAASADFAAATERARTADSHPDVASGHSAVTNRTPAAASTRVSALIQNVPERARRRFADPATLPEELAYFDAGLERSFELALNELVVRDPDTGKDRTIAIGPAADRAALLDEWARVWRETGLEPGLVLYPTNRERSEFTRRVVTREVLVQSSDADAARMAAQEAGLAFDSAPVSAPGCFVFLADSAPEALVAAEDLRDAGVDAAPILARQYARRAMPNDPLVGRQWHLKFQSQAGAVAGTDINVESVWNYPGAGIRGAGIRIGIIDDGLETAHPDLAANVDTVNDHDWNDSSPDTPEPSTDDDHGTACAGNAAARGNNGVGVSGSAPEATLVGLRLISGAVGDAEEEEALGWVPGLVQVKSNSWGPNDDGFTLEGPGTLAAAALKAGAATGRGGLGTIYLWAGGNGGDVLDDSNYDGYANSIYTIAIAALDSQSRQSWYSEPGANVVVAAPSNGDTPALGITTTDRSGSVGYNSGSTSGEISGQPNYTQTFGGTSSATPTAAGVAALILQANPNLGWRDVQEVLMASATKVNPSDSDWATNGGGFHFNHRFGAGLINAAAAVTLAQTWTNLGAHRTNTVTQATSSAIPDNSATGVTRTFDLSASNLRVEHVTVTVNVSNVPKGQLEVTLTSPAGTVSRLCEEHDDGDNTLSNWTFMTVRNWGENSTGTWTLKVADRTAGTTGSLTGAMLTVYGSDGTPVNPPPQVTLTAPTAGAVFSPGATVTLTATATDLALGGGPGVVSQVEFFSGATSLGVDTDAPYTLDWVPPTVGTYTLQARATDSESAVGSSSAVSIQVINQPPVITAGGLIPSEPAYSDTALDVTGVVATDPEGQSLTFAHQWQYSLNGTTWTDAPGAATATLAPSAANGAKLWRCRVIANDGASASAPWYAGPVALQSRPVTTGTAGQAYSYPVALYLRATDATFTRPAILNEFSQGSNGGEWVEILTLKTGSLRNFNLTDTTGPGITFADSALWDAIPAGTRIVVYNGSTRDPLLPADDTNANDDGRMVLASSSAYFTGSWPALGNSGDSLRLRDASNAVVSQVGYGNNTTVTPNVGSVGSGKAAYYFGDTEDGGTLATNWRAGSGLVARKAERATRVAATLPIAFGGPWNSLPTGFTGSGLGSPYAGSLGGDTGTGSAKFDTTNDSLTIELSGPAASVQYNLLGNSSSAAPTSGTFLLQESDTGVSYTTLRTHTNKSTADEAFTDVPAVSTRFIRFLYQTKTAGNIQLDKLAVAAGSSSGFSLSVVPNTFAENAGSAAATGTVTITPAPGANTTVTLASSDTGECTVPASVVVLAGQTTATFAVDAVDDLLSDGSQTVTLTATTAGFTDATASVTVTDNEASLDGVTPGAGNNPANTAFADNLRNGVFNQAPQYRLATASDVPAGLILDAATGLFSGTPTAGTYDMVIERVNGLGEVSSQSFTLVIDADGSPYGTWIAGFNGLSSTLPEDDADMDGLDNQTEFFMGLLPNANDHAGALIPASAPAEFSLTYRKSKTATGVTGAIFWKNDLMSPTPWSDAGITDVSVGGTTEYDLRRASVPLAPGETTKFLSLRVVVP